MKIRWWPRVDDPAVASHRLRCLQIIERLGATGVDAALFRPGEAPAPDALVLSKRYDPKTLAQALALRAQGGTRVMLDLCDNHLHVDNGEPRLLDRAAELQRAIAEADGVIAASGALAEVLAALAMPPRRLSVIADAAEPPFVPAGLARWREPRAEFALRTLAAALRRDGLPKARRLLWFGSHGSAGAEGGMADLLRIRDALESAHADRPLSLTIISNHREKYRQLTTGWRLPTRYLDWNAHSFSRAAMLHGTALIPVGLNPFTRCKTCNRVATAVLHGLNVVADAIPSYREFADCAVLDDWPRGLGPYLDDSGRREADLRAARTLLAERYSLDRIAMQWRTAIEGTVTAPALHGAAP